ncbi:MAG: flagellar basal-body MS-ring/collar protein FliF [Dehalococcoidia bacterium]
MGTLSTLPGDLVATWNRMPRGQKTILLMLGGGAIALFVLFTSWSRAPDFVPLYAGLDPADAGAVVDRLQSQGIPHQVSEGGTTVRVPSSQVAAARIDLASMGLPKGGGVGFEIFDEQSFGATAFVQRINLRRGLEGELTRTINQLDSVQGSRVHIAIPEKQLFTDLDSEASASVVLDVFPGRPLSQAQVRGVAHLVAQSVDGLDAENVMILNSKGDILFDGSDDLGAAGNTQLQLTQAFEDRLERDLGAFLRSVLGPNRSAVEVSAVLDFTSTETTTESFAPIDGGARSTQTLEETFAGSAADAFNVTGAEANVGALAGPDVDDGETGSTSNYSRTESTVNNELNRTLTVTTTAPGEIQALSISVVLDDEAVSEEQAADIQTAIAAAAGLDNDRGDQLTVTRIPFDTTELEEAEAAIAAEAAANASQNMMRLAVPILAVVLAAVFLWFFARKIGKARPVSAADQFSLAVSAGAGESVEQLQARLREEEARNLKDQQYQEATQYVRNQPKAVAEVVQTWVREDG